MLSPVWNPGHLPSAPPAPPTLGAGPGRHTCLGSSFAHVCLRVCAKHTPLCTGTLSAPSAHPWPRERWPEAAEGHQPPPASWAELWTVVSLCKGLDRGPPRLASPLGPWCTVTAAYPARGPDGQRILDRGQGRGAAVGPWPASSVGLAGTSVATPCQGHCPGALSCRSPQSPGGGGGCPQGGCRGPRGLTGLPDLPGPPARLNRHPADPGTLRLSVYHFVAYGPPPLPSPLLFLLIPPLLLPLSPSSSLPLLCPLSSADLAQVLPLGLQFLGHPTGWILPAGGLGEVTGLDPAQGTGGLGACGSRPAPAWLPV